jgi:hypothetical protein
MTRKKKYPFPLVEVVWTDAQTSHGWESEEETEIDIPIVTTVGFLIKETESGVRIASTIGADKSHNSRMDIPAKMIVTKKEL